MTKYVFVGITIIVYVAGVVLGDRLKKVKKTIFGCLLMTKYIDNDT